MNDMDAEALLRLRAENAKLRAEVERLHGEYVGHDHWWVALDAARKERDAALLQVDAQQKRLEEIGRIAWTCVNQHHRMGEIHELASPLKRVEGCPKCGAVGCMDAHDPRFEGGPDLRVM